ncbi:hypothetical protein BDW22DRAFT_1433447 [Trametopsis cervina]|nr:hypothetical protein BDW22DRAFT_1433447 [Trametopsis cervina]
MSTPGATATGLSLDTGLIPVSSSSIPELVGLPLIFGFILTMLYGVTSVQTYIYFYNNLHDSRVLKRTIFFLIIDTLLIIFNSISVYYYCVKVLMKPLLLTKLPWADGVGIILASLSDFIVTGIFAYRIRILCGRIWPLAFVIPPATLSFFVGTAVGIMA